ncbi:hypothetical protein AAYQ19_06945 [Flavobacterium sp. D4]
MIKLSNYSIILFAILSCLFSCKNTPKNIIDDANFDRDHAAIHEEMDKISAEFGKFRKELILLYAEGEKNPELALTKADTLLDIYNTTKEKYKSQIKQNVTTSINYLKAELYYKLGNYEQSIKELKKEKYDSGEHAAALAANYVKLKEFDKAKYYVEKIGPGFYIYDYALGNYYESIDNKSEALKIYSAIKANKEIKHYAYYPLAVARYDELKKEKPQLLNEIYFPTQNPSFEIADSDNENRTKIFDMVFALPEAKNKGVSIVESPQTNDKDYYLIKVGKNAGYITDDMIVEFTLYIYPKDFTMKYYDEKNNRLMTIEEWRNSR